MIFDISELSQENKLDIRSFYLTAILGNISEFTTNDLEIYLLKIKQIFQIHIYNN